MTDYTADFKLNKNTLEFTGNLNSSKLNFDCKITGREDKHYTHEQGTASNVWVIHHNLNKKPAIEVADSADTVITGFEAQYNDLNTVTISFNGAFTGFAYLN